MNNRGFTLVEILGVIMLLGIIVIIVVPVIGNSAKNAKIKTLESKIKNIEKAAVLYAQDEKISFDISCNSEETDVCYDIINCMCADEIDVKTLIDAGKIDYDKESDVINPVDETKSLNNCRIIIYKKYGKIYSHYLSEGTNDATCWVES